ncbi:MAG: TIGR00269 family protein [Thermoplasmatales archaeon]
MRCSFCDNDAVIHIRYNGTHLCEKHFIRFFQKRVNLEFRNEVKIKGNTRIGVALSGGKDSSVALFETKRVFGKMRNVSIIAITIDEGISGYRSKTIEAAVSLTKRLGVEHVILKMSDFYGITMDEISTGRRMLPCSYCGVFRRKMINVGALGQNLDYVVTGLNLDDTVQSFVMNMVRGDLERLSRMGPHFTVKEGLVPRLQPLRKIPEREVLLYAILEKIEFSHAECPYAGFAIRNEFRNSIDSWEERTPGTKFALLNSYDQIKSLLSQKRTEPLGKCRVCGSPTPGDICQSCLLKMEIETWTSSQG